MRKLFFIAPLVLLAACGEKTEAPASAAVGSAAEADGFIQKFNDERKRDFPYETAAAWLQATYINDDSQLVASKANENYLEYIGRTVEASKRFNGAQGLSPETARGLLLLKLQTAMPAPSDPALREELAKIASKMEANYGSGKWCRKDKAGNESCLTLQAIEKIINDPKTKPEERAAAWAGWHETSKPIRKDYQRFVELTNAGAKEMGFAGLADVWKGGYDMGAAEFETEVERLWGQVKPLYEQLHCYVRGKLNKEYGDALVPKNGPIPAHLLGNMWAQQWSNIYPQVEPYKGVGDLDVTSALKKQRNEEFNQLLAQFKGKPSTREIAELEYKADAAMALKMTRIAEDFYTSVGFPALPESFYKKSLLQEPRDRAVVCHASAWDMNFAGDVRIKQCIEPDEDQLYTIHHELGHIYYYLMYNNLAPIFQGGAHDGFHEAVGDTITLSLTPAHLKKIGLVKDVKTDAKALINTQMKLALDKIVFLPWGKLVDQWRWKVFNGEVKPENYNAAWWALREQYQGVSPPLARSEEDFDPGAKYHVPGNTPYTRYFLSFILQFQWQKKLCELSGHTGPLHECDIYGNKVAGEKFMEMLKLGQSQPWPLALEKLTGSKQMDASAIIDYFAPLMGYLAEQNKGQECGWTPPAAASPAAPPA
ncbi:MAG: M2 family metallopeptidase [Pseudomonadota bacterium]